MWVGAVSAAGVLATAIGTAVAVTTGGPLTAVGGLLAVDALSAFMLIVIGAVALVATVATPTHLRAELAAGRTDPRVCTQHSILVQLFLAAMALAVLAASLGVLWVAIEATTVVTAFLVGQRRGRGAVEAAWKYVIICSTGIALALLGTFLLNYAAQHAPTPAGLDWVGLTAAAPDLDPGVTRIAVLLLILGFGTKAGLAPLHAWLPDAHSPGPGPGVRADVRGADLGRLLRDPASQDHRRRRARPGLRPRPADRAVAGLDHGRRVIAVGATDYKRMLAYSSIENMGLLALGAAIGSPLAVAAVLLHILGHGLAKSVLFLSRRPGSAAHRVQPDRPRPRPGRAGPGAGRVPGIRRAGDHRVPAVQPVRQRTGHRDGRFRRRSGLGHRGGPDPGAGHRGGPGGSHQPDAARRPHAGPCTGHRQTDARRGSGPVAPVTAGASARRTAGTVDGEPVDQRRQWPWLSLRQSRRAR